MNLQQLIRIANSGLKEVPWLMSLLATVEERLMDPIGFLLEGNESEVGYELSQVMGNALAPGKKSILLVGYFREERKLVKGGSFIRM